MVPVGLQGLIAAVKERLVPHKAERVERPFYLGLVLAAEGEGLLWALPEISELDGGRRYEWWGPRHRRLELQHFDDGHAVLIFPGINLTEGRRDSGTISVEEGPDIYPHFIGAYRALMADAEDVCVSV